MPDAEIYFQIIVAGFFAAYVHLVTALWVPGIGLPKLDLSAAIAELSFGDAWNGKPPYLLGALVILINGIFLAFIYACLVAPLLPGSELIRGILWGFILFCVSGAFFAPIIMKDGFFMSKVHPRAWVTALIIHIEFGAIIGWLCPVCSS